MNTTLLRRTLQRAIGPVLHPPPLTPSRARTLHSLDSLQQVELPLPCAAEIELIRRAAERDRRSKFAVLPGRVDCGIDTHWGSRPHRLKVGLGRWVAARLGRGPQPVYLRGPVNSALRGLVVGVLLEALLVGGAVLYVVVRKVY